MHIQKILKGKLSSIALQLPTFVAYCIKNTTNFLLVCFNHEPKETYTLITEPLRWLTFPLFTTTLIP